jgi:hypothetical protein
LALAAQWPPGMCRVRVPRHCPRRRDLFVNRLWNQVGVRVASVGLLLTGVAGGVYLGQDRETQQQSAEVSLVVQADAAERELLIERHAEHAAARAPQRKAEADAAAKASREAKAAASKARKLEKAVLKKKAEAAAAAKAKKEAEADEGDGGGSSSGPSKPFTGPIPSSCKEYSGNRRIGCALLVAKGFGLSQMPCLDKLWKKESGWNHKASNRSSGAYGIPQSLPGSKMASAGSDWRTNPATQIKWGLGYIKGRYGSPCGAWSHSQSHGWY